ncbi:MAG: TolC family protein [Bacteroidota bacterium]|nr:TolC family protein [Bacteroidota bacterium]
MKLFSKKNVLVTAMICMLPFMALKAQDTLKVSLPKALEIALSQSPTIKVSDKEIIRVDYSKKEKFAALFPNISAGGTYSRSIESQKMILPVAMFGLPAGTIIPGFVPDNSFGFGISASLPIISPTLWATLKMTKLDAQLALESSRSSKLSLINQVTKAYYGILLAQDSYNVFRRSYENTVENARIIQNKFKQGTVSEFEWIRADVQVRNAQSNVVSAETAVNMSILQLKMLIGMDMFTGLKVEGSLADFETNMYGDVLAIDTTTLHTNTDLNQFDIKAKQLNHTLMIQKAAWWPTLAASFSYQYQSMGNSGVPLSTYSWFPVSSAGLSVSIPIFQGGTRLYKEKQLQIQIDELKDQRDNLRRSLELQVISCLDNIKKAMQKISSNKEGLRQAEKAVSISQKRYDVGSGTYLDITDSELAYITAGLSYNQSIFDYLSAKSDLEKLLGKDTAGNKQLKN